MRKSPGRVCRRCGRDYHPEDKAVMCEGCGHDNPLTSAEKIRLGIYDRDDAILSDILSLVNLEISPEAISTWTEQQCQEAENWACKVYLKASDNQVKVPRKPQFLEGK